jgi:hypothetical protein
MKKLAGLILFSLVWGSINPAWSKVGTSLSFETFRPFLARRYNTLLGWKGYPVTLVDPHLYLHDRKTLRLIASVEFQVSQMQIRGVIFKMDHPYQKLTFDEQQELNWFLVLASDSRVTPYHLKAAFERKQCQDVPVFRMGLKPDLWLTVFSDYQTTFVKISMDGPPSAPFLSNCL